MRRVCIVLGVLFFLMAVDMYAGWGTGNCMPVGISATTATYRWISGDDQDQIHLYFGNSQVGTFRYSDGLYYPFNGSDWEYPTKIPVGTPPVPGVVGRADKILPECVPVPQADIVINKNFGVDWRPDDSRGERITFTSKEGTVEIPRKTANQIVGADLRDDSSFLRLTIIDPDKDKRKKIALEISKHPAFQKYLIQDYSPDHWAVKDSGFRYGPGTTIYIQRPPSITTGYGEVLHRQSDYNDGLEGVVKAVRKIDPNYNSEKDPDLRKDPATGAGWIMEHITWVLSGIVCFLVWAFTPDFRRLYS